MWRDIKSFTAHLNHNQKEAFLDGYARIFKKQGYTVEKMKEFLSSEAFKNL